MDRERIVELFTSDGANAEEIKNMVLAAYLSSHNNRMIEKEETMLEFISKDVREYMEQNHLEFTDFEKATLIYNANLPVLEKLERLEKLAEDTEDTALREQILARLIFERQDLEAFHSNTEGYVYTVEKHEDDDVCGYFATADLAYAHGMKQECKFRIEKYLIVGFNGREAKKSQGYRGSSEAGALYGKDGTLNLFWSSEIKRPYEEDLDGEIDYSRFENAFIHTPNPFQRGDIVRSLEGQGAHGVVVTSQEEWNEFLKWAESGKIRLLGFSDARITVDLLLENGQIMHSHICPVFLEKFEPQKEDLDYNVLTVASAVHQGDSLDFFVFALNEYQKQLSEKK